MATRAAGVLGRALLENACSVVQCPQCQLQLHPRGLEARAALAQAGGTNQGTNRRVEAKSAHSGVSRGLSLVPGVAGSGKHTDLGKGKGTCAERGADVAL